MDDFEFASCTCSACCLLLWGAGGRNWFVAGRHFSESEMTCYSEELCTLNVVIRLAMGMLMYGAWSLLEQLV